MKLRSSILSCACLLMGFQSFGAVWAQTTEQKVTLGANEVLLDVVVRDKKGRPVKDLGAGDFEVYEDGVKQEVKSFRIHQTGSVQSSTGAAGQTAAAHGGPPNPFAGLGVVALVFDRLSPNAREAAHKAALGYVGAIGKDDLAGVFLVDLSLEVLQPFTSNTDLLSRAVDRAASLSTSGFPTTAEQSAQITNQLANLLTENPSPSAGNGTGNGANLGPGGAPNQGAVVEIMMLEMTNRILNSFETLERDEQGYATTNALLGVINALKTIEGRKAIVFFSEGVAIPPAVASRFQAVISAANQANVSIYPIDAAGLRTESTMAATQRQQDAIVKTRMASQETGAEDTSGRPMTRDLERNEDVLHLDPHSSLGQLADQTGGFNIADTNNLKGGLSRIDEDLRFHYVISYAPKNASYDGRFRKIAVKVDKAGVEVQARKGYYALPATGDSPVLDYETSALAALANSKAKEDPGLHAAAFSFPEPLRPGLVPIVIDVPPSEITYGVDKANNTYKADFTVVAVLKNPSGAISTKVSEHYQLSGPADKVDEEKKSDVLFYREANLPPGKYSVEAVTYDTATQKTNLKSGTVDVPAADKSLRMSSIAVLRRVERLTDPNQQANNPFHYKQVLIYPNLGRPLSKTAGKQVAFFCTIYPAKDQPAAPTLSVKVRQGGNLLFDKPATLGPPDSTGRIQYAGALPLEAFPVGTYDLEITATDEHGSVSRTAQFTVQP